MKSVFVVETGEKHEGSCVISVHTTYSGAFAAAMKVPAHFEDGWKFVSQDYWENGCDFLGVTEYKVQK
jgi:hypothetical protein